MNVATMIKSFLTPFYHDLFIVESFELFEENELKDIRVKYRFRGKRKVTLSNRLTKIILDKKLLSCFSREDNFELGMWYGRIKNTNLHSEKKA